MKRQKQSGRVAAQRLLATTRGQILLLLCKGRYTVADLARELGLTDNAVRAQLDRLQRQGLAQPAGARRGVRRPHVEYELGPKASELFPRAYEPVLQKVVDVLVQRLPERFGRDLLVEAGRSLLTEHLGDLRGRSPQERLAEIMSKLNGAGLGIELAEQLDKTVVRACSCPLASVTAVHPRLCEHLSSALGDILQGDVREKCERDGQPRCRFEVVHARQE